MRLWRWRRRRAGCDGWNDTADTKGSERYTDELALNFGCLLRFMNMTANVILQERANEEPAPRSMEHSTTSTRYEKFTEHTMLLLGLRFRNQRKRTSRAA